MTDVHSKATRSKNMAAVRNKDTKSELLVRKALHRLGFRYRLHDRKLPGKPDLVLPKYNAVIFVHGCFWHQHDCHLFKWPSTREEFWREKIEGNRTRDIESIKQLQLMGWRVLTIWECSLKGKSRLPIDDLLSIVSNWIVEGSDEQEVRGENK
ncbi:MAG: very short patch repair endonuclease [Zetaproteobacteria bacterium CG_4_9_14_3_um_filter_49_83]|nr:MAG: very short patch repair endonuclease [Zetaproteobacteria bacterium CG1_02_49_23]PIQ34101.1 MAG: very short patch repair endonuclease [Zetaproteobacteria bacterium CG17_big_fil_post_rev_8_21_14_2_50_50_13]PIV30222.1 MAG: very short patch repair endonuclease [Zetaproteobacteria bacterium CG02_land_8_20_14_3_00_50_9]PIY55851.1 MAG: very short patch repair endonuclease [Zetaproteobacteria bacterium CG_4_10_14_0_8_um_filter_49_80]PJA34981.1 MAG: very short patch repair endonuclease [Zetaprot